MIGDTGHEQFAMAREVLHVDLDAELVVRSTGIEFALEFATQAEEGAPAGNANAQHLPGGISDLVDAQLAGEGGDVRGIERLPGLIETDSHHGQSLRRVAGEITGLPGPPQHSREAPDTLRTSGGHLYSSQEADGWYVHDTSLSQQSRQVR